MGNIAREPRLPVDHFGELCQRLRTVSGVWLRPHLVGPSSSAPVAGIDLGTRRSGPPGR
jgi:hypothetical protein